MRERNKQEMMISEVAATKGQERERKEGWKTGISRRDVVAR